MAAMGYMKHHAIIVTSWNDQAIEAAFIEAEQLGCSVTPILTARINHYRSFMVGPDGSKEGWPESDAGDRRRAAFLHWMTTTQRYEDGSGPLRWVEIEYADEGGKAPGVLRHDEDAKAIRDWSQATGRRT